MRHNIITICSSSKAIPSSDQAYDVIGIDWKGEENEKEASLLATNEAKKWSSKKILWNLDLGFTSDSNLMEDEVLFHSRRVLVEYFGETCLQEGLDTFGVVLFTGMIDFENRLVWTENIENHYLELLEERSLEKSAHTDLWKRGYALEILAEYLHKLGSYLQEDIRLFCLLDATSLKSPAEVLYLLSKERFLHVELIVKGCALPIASYAKEIGIGLEGGWDMPKKPKDTPFTIALVNPSIEIWNDTTVMQVNQVVAELENRLIHYRVVNELTLTEEWDGIEVLVVLEESLTPTLKRKLQGYLASGGEVVAFGALGKLLGMENTPFETWVEAWIESRKRKSE